MIVVGGFEVSASLLVPTTSTPQSSNKPQTTHTCHVKLLSVNILSPACFLNHFHSSEVTLVLLWEKEKSYLSSQRCSVCSHFMFDSLWILWIKVHPLFCLTQFYQSMFSVRPFFEHFFPFSCHLWRTMIHWWLESSRTSDWEILPNVVEVVSLLIEIIVCSELTLCESFEDIKWQFCFLFPQAVIKSDRKSVLITVVHLVPVLWKGVKTIRGPWSVLDYSVSKDLSAN